MTSVMTEKNMKKNIRKLTKVSSDSYSVVIPKEIIRKYGWKEKQKLIIEDNGRGVVQLRDWRTKR